MPYLIIVRHGQSEWNRKNLFTGSVDISLSEKGKQQAREAGAKLRNYPVHAAFSSDLKRAKTTLEIILNEIGFAGSVHHCPELNERHFGRLQGKDKDEMRQLYGARQVEIWRQSYDIAPPGGETLLETEKRILPFFIGKINPLLLQNKNVLIVGHSNSSRVIVKYIEKLGEDDISKIHLKNAIPLCYELDNQLNLINKAYL